MNRNLIVKNAKFNSKTSDAIIRVKEVDGDVAIIETVVRKKAGYQSVPKSERVINVTSIQKAYECGEASTAVARLRKGAVLNSRRNPGNYVQVTQVSGDHVHVSGVYQHGDTFKLIAGSSRVVQKNCLLVSYKQIK